MQLVATTRTGGAGKELELLSILLGTKTRKAIGFPEVFLKKLAPGAQPGTESTKGGTRVSGSTERYARGEKEKDKQEADKTLAPLLVVPEGTVSTAKLELCVRIGRSSSVTADDVVPSKDGSDAPGSANGGPESGTPKNVLNYAGAIAEVQQKAVRALDGSLADKVKTARSTSRLDLRVRPPKSPPPELKHFTASQASSDTDIAQSDPAKPQQTAENSQDSTNDISLNSLRKGPLETGHASEAISKGEKSKRDREEKDARVPASGRSERPTESAIMRNPAKSFDSASSAFSSALGDESGSTSKKPKVQFADKAVLEDLEASQTVRPPTHDPFLHGPFQTSLSQDVPVTMSRCAADLPIRHGRDVESRSSQTPMAFHSLRLAEHIAGPELHFSWRSPDSGEIQLSANLHHREVQMMVNTEKSDTAAAMRAELPSLGLRLEEHSLRLGEVNIVARESGVSMGMDLTGQQRGHRDWNMPLPSMAALNEGLEDESGRESMLADSFAERRVSVLA